MEFSLGLVEVSSLGHAIMMLDEMLKAAEVEFVAVERKLGGRLVTIVVRGSISSVTASVERGREFAMGLGCLKAAEVIARPHPEILKFIHLDKEFAKEPEPKKEPAPKTKPAKESAPKKAAPKTKKSQAEKASDIKESPKKGKKTK